MDLDYEQLYRETIGKLAKNIKSDIEEEQSKENLVDPQNDKFRIAQNMEIVREYDLIEDNLTGQMPKRFLMLDKNIFSEFFDECKSKNSYVTYLGDYAKDEERIPSYISTLVKEATLSKKLVHEVLTPNIFNYFGYDTVYNKSLMTEDGHQYVASIDFIKPDEHLILLCDLIGDYDFNASCGIAFCKELVDEALEKLSENLDYKLSVEDKNKIDEEFVKAYLIRVLLLGDWDYSSRNAGVMVNTKSKKIYFAPNFDFEACFFNKNLKILQDLEYLQKDYFDILSDFCENLEKFSQVLKNDEMFKKYVSVVTGGFKLSPIGIDAIKSNTFVILDNYSKIKNNQMQ